MQLLMKERNLINKLHIENQYYRYHQIRMIKVYRWVWVIISYLRHKPKISNHSVLALKKIKQDMELRAVIIVNRRV